MSEGRPRTGPRRPASGRDLQRLPELIPPAVDSVPGLARVAARAAWHTTEWGVRTSARSWLRVGRALTDRSEAKSLVSDAGDVAQVVGDLARSLTTGTPVGEALLDAGEALGGIMEPTPSPWGSVVDGAVVDPHQNGHGHHGHGGREPEPPSLREQGQALLRRSRDVWSDDDAGHPAYGRILGELAPDEARILVLLVRNGPQPSVDVRTGGPIGMVNSSLIAPGLNMIGARAGVRHVDQVPAYLNNLFRLGLIWFSRESLRDPMEYQVVEAQPDVLSALHSVKFAKVVRRSIHLTPFGEDFCRTVLLDETQAAVALPEHSAPPPEAAEPPSTS